VLRAKECVTVAPVINGMGVHDCLYIVGMVIANIVFEDEKPRPGRMQQARAV